MMSQLPRQSVLDGSELGLREFYILGFAIVAMSFVAVVTFLW
jgi:hypothetical protein